MEPQIVLASASPRRQELLKAAGVAFTVEPSAVEESLAAAEGVDQLVQDNALAKARDVAARMPDKYVVGADTIVVLDAEVLGKPADMTEARRMLERLAGREHDVLTGLALIHHPSNTFLTAVERTRVRFRHLNGPALDAYLAAFHPLDKAGAYAVQGPGALVIEGVTGCYYNVVGLPLYALERLFERVGRSLLCDAQFRQPSQQP